MGSLPSPNDCPTGASARAAARSNTILSTSGLAPDYLQANLIVLPSRYADDFRLLCKRNPVPCPLLAESASVGDYSNLKSWLDGVSSSALAKGLDIRTDAPRYMVYKDGALIESHIPTITPHWTPDHVLFLIGCSYSFEAALTRATPTSLIPRHTLLGRVVPMYRTTLPLCPAGVFASATYVVSMRPYPARLVARARDITRPYVATHGEPVAWGWAAVRALGIADLARPEWGDPPVTERGEPLADGDDENVPVFWGCGVTPQEAVVRAGLEGVVMGHAPGHMVVLDVTDRDVFGDGV
ncbi:Carbonic anhydrase [Macrophomina phaseolina MS6]|uniref:Carbonic anhydrase n=1 Tax=Macrophomina phaseolina (strain MS6) TaxID=1126212 RepID=K2S8Q6_MACPH|nr:Carbonic anhydrase [Macrophomina phaseolina MS6]